MKKLFFITGILQSLFFNAQDSKDETAKLSELVHIATGDANKRDSVIIELNKLVNNTQNPEISKVGKESLNLFKELQSISKDVTPSKYLSELNSDDLRNFKINKDKFKESAFIHHKKEGDLFYPYLSLKDGNIYMRLVADYSGKDWIFFDNLIFIADGNKYEINFPNTDRTIGSGYVYERGDTFVSKDILEILRKISVAGVAEVRFSGKSVYDRKLSRNQINVLYEIIALYDKLKK